MSKYTAITHQEPESVVFYLSLTCNIIATVSLASCSSASTILLKINQYQNNNNLLLLLWSVTTAANSLMSQSEFLETICYFLKVQEKLYEQGVIAFSFAFH